MQSMDYYPRAAMERAMKVQEVILQAMARKISWYQAAEIIGISDRHMRRWRERYEEFGFRGLFDRRRGKPSPKRVPVAVVEKVLGLYSGEVFRSEPAALSRETAGGAPGRDQLQLGEGNAARGGVGGQGAQARSTSPAAAAAAFAGDVAAHRWQ